MYRPRPARPLPARDGLVAWSAPIGRWAGVPVRVHASLAVVLVAALTAAIVSGSGTLALAIAAYVGSLVLHELAHLAAAARWRPPAPRAQVLGPLGGLRLPQTTDDPRERVFVAMAGPLANLAVVVAAMCVLALGEGARPADLVAAFAAGPVALFSGEAMMLPPGVTPAAALAVVLIGVNWPLCLVNVLPASPFDGGEAFRSLVRTRTDSRAASEAAAVSAVSVAAGLCGGAAVAGVVGAADPWLACSLAALATLLVFGAWRDWWAAHHDVEHGPHWGGDASDDRPRVLIEQGERTRRRTAERDNDRSHDPWAHGDWEDDEEEAFSGESDDRDEATVNEPHGDEVLVDEVLAKVHAMGIHRLTPAERAVLHRASQRYRRRRDG
ncbi:MAG: site-2 protease family protein [Planctomycetota bacterium]